MAGALCRALSDLGSGDVPLAGGKGANLGELVRAGFDVPDGFVVTTAAYRLAHGRTEPPPTHDVAAPPVPRDVAAAIRAAYAQLGAGPVAVRSSATAEDLPGATFAGQQDTLLDVLGADDVVAAVRRCWASLWTERAVAYRQRLGIDATEVAMAVVVQRLVVADHAGVLLTADPVTGDRSRVVVDSSPGLGEAVVSGLVTPDHAVLDARGRVVERRAGRREVVLTAHGDGTGMHRVPGGELPAVPDVDLVRLADVGRRVAAHFGRPQDVEWAIQGTRLWVLQARPMTALPPPPVRLGPVQRRVGPVLLELLPRRPLPMELTAWIRPTVATHLERMFAGAAGVALRFDALLPADDDDVQAFVPPSPRPTRRTPVRLWRSLRRARHVRLDDWRSDPRYGRYRDGVDALGATDPAGSAWADLIAVPARAAELVDLVTGLRVDHLPAAGLALGRLRVLLAVLHRGRLFGDLVLDAPTATKAANAALGALADLVRQDPRLVAAFTAADPTGAAALVADDDAAAGLRARLHDFAATFGHRETTSILLVRDPGWGEAPGTVLRLVRVLLDERGGGDARTRSAAAREVLLRHPVVRLTRSRARLEGLVHRAAAGVAFREDTHFELTRTMPPVRRAVEEAGRRLQRRGLLDDAEDVWMLTLDELATVDDRTATVDHRTATGDAAVDLRGAVRRRRSAYAELAASPLIGTTTLYGRRRRGRRDADALVSGVGGGGGSATGPVRLVRGPDEFATVRSGDVLVCAATNPSWTPLFQRVAAVVVDHGGLASHAAIVAREYGIPAVMGTATATAVLQPGQVVHVDGDAGVVRAAVTADG
ncbi:PEP/pyruvate-binding domain-containing protein [Cellulomonas sp. ATA003]|uniref:PEP/pyruvate-binding domain-containing protein n=1 Tax=Cellulomonas sp. ATA003 TaxID=3073064 RepID=UPI00287320ED|nr:PEP/pyruvate-binding domain-containing protein [Cellulomonas sp. ATA003]WNB85471.1 PEP/pyruvate-binding domain-containing protein [Cellulomonas sp. ATA003]